MKVKGDTTMNRVNDTKRRTVSVKALIETVNLRNRSSTCGPQEREGWNSLLETVLHASNVYSGFSYLSKSEVPAGQAPGIVPEGDGYVFPDETRRAYHFHRALTQERRPVSRLPRDPMGAHGTLPSGDVL